MRFYMKPTYATTILLSAAVLAGCSSPTVNTDVRANPTAHPQVIQDMRIVTDQTLNAYCQVVGVYKTTVSTDLLKIQVDVYNSQSEPAQFNYKFEWIDQDGIIVDTPLSIWKTQTIQGGEVISLTAVAPNPRATDFRLKMQAA
jgi:uncharacterized protein YcfL